MTNTINYRGYTITTTTVYNNSSDAISCETFVVAEAFGRKVSGTSLAIMKYRIKIQGSSLR